MLMLPVSFVPNWESGDVWIVSADHYIAVNIAGSHTQNIFAIEFRNGRGGISWIARCGK